MTNRESNPSNKCFTLRQWALCISLIIFSITGVFTTFAGLGKIHIDHVWDLVNADIQEEHQRSVVEGAIFGKHLTTMSTNEQKLRASKQLTLVGSWLLYVFTWVGCLNLAAAVLLIYGITMKAIKYMIPWIIISAISYISVMIAIFIIHSQLFPGMFVSLGAFFGSLTASTIFILFWYVIALYYSELKNLNRAKLRTLLPTIIKATNGYVHTLSSAKKSRQEKARPKNVEKQLIA